MKDKTKKWLAVVILLAVCAGLLFGIHRMFYRAEKQRECRLRLRRQKSMWKQRRPM